MTSKAKNQLKNAAYGRGNIGEVILLAMVALVLSAGCASMQTWPEQQRSAETKMFTIQGKIGDGLKTGTLTPDQSQAFLTELKAIRTDYEALSGKSVYKQEWNTLHGRLDALDAEISRERARGPGAGNEGLRTSDRISLLQGRLDDGRLSGRLPLTESRDFQSRLDAIRRDHYRLTDGNRPATYEEQAEISRRLDALEIELNRFR